MILVKATISQPNLRKKETFLKTISHEKWIQWTEMIKFI